MVNQKQVYDLVNGLWKIWKATGIPTTGDQVGQIIKAATDLCEEAGQAPFAQELVKGYLNGIDRELSGEAAWAKRHKA